MGFWFDPRDEDPGSNWVHGRPLHDVSLSAHSSSPTSSAGFRNLSYSPTRSVSNPATGYALAKRNESATFVSGLV